MGPPRSTRALHPIPGRRRLARGACVAQACGAVPPPARGRPSLSPHRPPSRYCTKFARTTRLVPLPPPTPPPSPSPRGRPQCAQLPPRLPRSPPFCPSPPRFPPPRLTCACHAHPPRGAPTLPHHGGLCRGCRVCAGGGFPAEWRSQRPPADRFDGHPASGGAPGRVGHLDEGAE